VYFTAHFSPRTLAMSTAGSAFAGAVSTGLIKHETG
jgi:hypothetical protein